MITVMRDCASRGDLQVFPGNNIIALTKLCPARWTCVAAILTTFSPRSIFSPGRCGMGTGPSSVLRLTLAGPSGKNSVRPHSELVNEVGIQRHPSFHRRFLDKVQASRIRSPL
jgi:hypothetical protein